MGLKEFKTGLVKYIGHNQQMSRRKLLSVLSACRYFFSVFGLIMGIRNSDSSAMICETNLMQQL